MGIVRPADPAPPDAADRAFARTWTVVVFVAAALVLGLRLGEPSRGPGEPPPYVHDECFQAFTAHRYVLGDRQAWNPRAGRDEMLATFPGDIAPGVAYEWVHPPSAKLIMAAFIRAFGFRPLAYRLPSALCGLLTLLLTWRLARRFGDARFALLAAVILASDGMWFVMSRIAMNDIYATACVVAGAASMHRFWTVPGPRARHVLLSGAIYGLGISMKWTAGPPALLAALLAVTRIVWDGRRGRPVRRDLAAWAAGFVLLAPAIYLASYAPYFLDGHSWADFVTLNREIGYYHEHLAATHSQSSRWFQWLVDYKPVWFFSRVSEHSRRVIYAMGNPVVWWLFLPAIGWRTVLLLRHRRAEDGLMVCGFCSAWLPWALVGRVTFLQYLLPAVPFGALAIAATLRDLAAWRHGSRLLTGYAAACVLTFAHFYPVWSALPVAEAAYESHRWFWRSSWR